MRSLFVVLFYLLIAVSKLYSSNLPLGDNHKADSLVNASYEFYDSQPEKFILLNKEALRLYRKSNSKKKMAQVFQNLAFVYTEKIRDYKLANENVSLSISLWKELNNTLQEANLIKYKGLINGYLKDYDAAKRDIHLSIKKFKDIDFPKGVYISYLDLAMVYEQEKKLDSCIYYTKLNKEYFESCKDTSRTFIANNKLINYYLLSKEYDKAKELVISNKKMSSSNEIKEIDKEEFRKISQHKAF